MTLSCQGPSAGGGLAGTSTTTKDVFDGTNKGSTLNVGGNANIKSADTVTITLHADGSVSVADDGRGLPIDSDPVNGKNGIVKTLGS